MPGFVKMATLDELPAGASKEVEHEGRIYAPVQRQWDDPRDRRHLPAPRRTAGRRRRWKEPA